MAVSSLFGPLGNAVNSAYNFFNPVPVLKDTGTYTGGTYNQGTGQILGAQNTQQPQGPGGAYPKEMMGPPLPPAQANPAFSAPQATPVTTGTGGTGDNTQGGGINLDALYNDAFKNLDSQMNSLAEQRGSQEQIVNNQYQQGVNTLGNQYAQNKGQIESQQTKTLNELSDALRQQWQQGNAMLGSRGATDSSAANQYAYALTRLGTKQRGDIMTEINGRLNDLKQTYDTNLNNLELQKNSELQQIASWFSDAQNQIRGMQGNLQQEKSQQALSVAMQMFQQIQQNAANQKGILDQWAANNSKTLTQLQSQLQANTQNLPTFQGLNGVISGGQNVLGNLFGFNNNDETKKQLGLL